MEPGIPLRILVVEDSPPDAVLAMRLLRQAGYELQDQRVETRQDYLAALAELRPDLVISDYALPQFDGMQALRLAQQHDPDLPVIVFTGAINEETAVECMKAGAADYVLKEQMSRLPFAVAGALEARQARRTRAAAEEALRASEERHRLVLEHSGAGVGYYDLEGRTLFLNHVALGRLKGEAKGFLGRSMIEIYGVEYGERFLARLHKAAAGQGSQQYEDFVTLPVGPCWYLSEYSRVVNGVGEVIGVQIVSQDITARRAAERAVADREAELAAIYDNAPLLMLLVDAERRVRKANCSSEGFGGSAEAGMIGLRCGEALHCLGALGNPQGCG